MITRKEFRKRKDMSLGKRFVFVHFPIVKTDEKIQGVEFSPATIQGFGYIAVVAGCTSP